MESLFFFKKRQLMKCMEQEWYKWLLFYNKNDSTYFHSTVNLQTVICLGFKTSEVQNRKRK